MNKSGLLGKRIPTVVGLLILIGGLVAGVILVSQRQGLGTKAGPTDNPKNVRVTNKGTNVYSVSWTTDTPTTGFIKHSENPTKITTPAGDVRDQISGTAQSYTNHYVNITGLKADTTYYFVIGSGSQTYTDEGKPFQVRTGPQIIPASEDVVSGKVVNETAIPVNGAVVFIEAEGGEALSTVTKVDGTWRLDLASSRDSNGQVLAYDANETILSIFVQASTGGTATAITNTAKDNPVPDIILGKNQSFVDSVPQPISEGDGVNSLGFGSLAAAPTPAESVQLTDEVNSSVSIQNPAINGEMIATSSPQFRGVAIPNTDITITVESNPQTALIKAAADGLWSWTPPLALEPGIHTLNLEYTEGGVLKRIERTFTVLAYESDTGLPAFTATPSATIALTPTPTITPTLTPAGASDSGAVATPTPTDDVSMPATDSAELTESGGEWMSILLVGSGLFMLAAGKLLKRFTESIDEAV